MFNVSSTSSNDCINATCPLVDGSNDELLADITPATNDDALPDARRLLSFYDKSVAAKHPRLSNQRGLSRPDLVGQLCGSMNSGAFELKKKLHGMTRTMSGSSILLKKEIISRLQTHIWQ